MIEFAGGAQGRPLENPEVALNLWAYSDDDGTVMRIAGRAYVLTGNDREKLAKLHHLAGSDFLAARWEKVPDYFVTHGPGGKEMRGVTSLSVMRTPEGHANLFGPLMKLLQRDLPQQVRSVRSEYEAFSMTIPDEPLCVTTIVIEREDGALVPMISQGHS